MTDQNNPNDWVDTTLDPAYQAPRLVLPPPREIPYMGIASLLCVVIAAGMLVWWIVTLNHIAAHPESANYQKILQILFDQQRSGEWPPAVRHFSQMFFGLSGLGILLGFVALFRRQEKWGLGGIGLGIVCLVAALIYHSAHDEILEKNAVEVAAGQELPLQQVFDVVQQIVPGMSGEHFALRGKIWCRLSPNAATDMCRLQARGVTHYFKPNSITVFSLYNAVPVPQNRKGFGVRLNFSMSFTLSTGFTKARMMTTAEGDTRELAAVAQPIIWTEPNRKINVPWSDISALSASIKAPDCQYGRCGMTWGVKAVEAKLNATAVSCDGKPNGAVYGCDSNVGDTNCENTRPILCAFDGTLPRPEGLPKANDDFGWSRGRLNASVAVQGEALSSRTDADSICARELGKGWRIASDLDGGLENAAHPEQLPKTPHSVEGFWAQGQIPANQRFWVATNGKFGNCWSAKWGREEQ